MKVRLNNNTLDILVKILGVFTIFIPLFLFYKQQEAENNRNWQNKKVDEYSELLVSIHKLGKVNPFSKEFEEDHNTIFYDIYPKLLIFNDHEVLNQIDSLKSLDEFLLRSKEVLDKSIEADSLATILLDSAGLNMEKYTNLYHQLEMRAYYYYFKGTDESLKKEYSGINNLFVKKYADQLDSLSGTYTQKIAYLEDNEKVQKLDFASTMDYVMGNSNYFRSGMIIESRIELLKRIDQLDSVVIHTLKDY